MSRLIGAMGALKVTRRELRNFALATLVLSGLFTLGASAVTPGHAHGLDLCMAGKFFR